MLRFCVSSLFLLLLINLCAKSEVFAKVQIVDVIQKCQNECDVTTMTTTVDLFDVHCNDTCRITQCVAGCQRWQDAVETNKCQDSCTKHNDSNETFVENLKHLYCVIGCRFAGGLYVQSVRDVIGIPAAPTLVADSQTNASVSIQWEGASADTALLYNVSYLVQWRFEALPGGWEYYRPKVPIAVTTERIEGLQPYTKYRFRVAWIILPQHEAVVSSESVVISTAASGVPSTSPIITSLAHVDSTRLSVTWEPPWFPNGPILSYVVHLEQLPTGFNLIKDIPKPTDENYFTFTNLRPQTTYRLALSCRNSMGEGPTEIRMITTPSRPELNSTQDPFLVFGANLKVLKLGLEMFDERQVLYHPVNDSTTITGVALHVHRQLLFVADESGFIHRVPTTGLPLVDAIVTPDRLRHLPQNLSVDWLNDRLYFVEGPQISRCDLDGANYEALVIGLDHVPTDMKVDPYNGYLYWTTPTSNYQRGGLYQADLSSLGNGYVIGQGDARHLVTDDQVTTFAIDHRNFRILYPNDTENAMYALSLNGLEKVDIRQNSQQPQFRSLKSLAFFHDLFYWTTGDEVYGEEFHIKQNKYYHNAIYSASGDRPFTSINVMHTTSQPIPVPANPVRNLQAVFKETMAKLSWKTPKPLGGLGAGSWQNWTYEVSIEEKHSNVSVVREIISNTEYTVENLKPATQYSIKIRACSEGGKGPWCDPFIGRSLKNVSQNDLPYIVWGEMQFILKSDIIGHNVTPLIHETNLQNSHVLDMSWHKDLLFLNTNTSRIFVYNMSDHQSLTLLSNVTSAVSIAVDWLGQKLYWSNPKQQMIARSNFDGSQMEPLIILTIAKDLTIDAINGFMYWTTSHSVECARLNGDEKYTYLQTGFFSGKKVVGLTLDIDHRRVYWMVWSHEGVRLFHAHLAPHYGSRFNNDRTEMPIADLSSLPEDKIQGPLHYYSHHLYWLHGENEALISDIHGKNIAHLRGLNANKLSTLLVVSPTLHPYPDGRDPNVANSVVVIPVQVKEDSVKVNGIWTDFNITWAPVSNVNYGEVHYEISVEDKFHTKKQVSDLPYYVYRKESDLPPHSIITFSVRAYTYWASAKRLVKTLRSPMSVPSEPRRPRAFVTSNSSPFDPVDSDSDVRVEFRWSPPRRPNGVVLGYVVTCWPSDDQRRRSPDPIWEEDVPSTRKLVYVTEPLADNATYFFQVRAYTEVGEGPPCAMIEVSTGQESPVPMLLLAQSNAVELADVDSHEREQLSDNSARPVDVAYLWEDSALFWLEQDDALIKSNMNGSNRTRLRKLTATGSSLSVDWLGRRLYWSEVNEGTAESAIWVLDLNSRLNEPRAVLRSRNTIRSVEVEPFSSTLLYIDVLPGGKGRLMTCRTDGTGSRPLFSPTYETLPTPEQISSPMESDRVRREAAPHSVTIDPSFSTAASPKGTEEASVEVTSPFGTLSAVAASPLPLVDDDGDVDDGGRQMSPPICNCVHDVAAGSAMAVDFTDLGQPELLWTDAKHGHLLASDLEGCQCRVVVNATQSVDSGLPPTAITVDNSHIYWSNATTGRIYQISRVPQSTEGQSGTLVVANGTEILKFQDSNDIRAITALGSHLQPYPDIACLVPQPYDGKPQLLNASSSSLTLRLIPAQLPPDCGAISMATVNYTIYYAIAEPEATEDPCNPLMTMQWPKPERNASTRKCFTVSTANLTITLADLQSSTKYFVRIKPYNRYSKFDENPSEGSKKTFFNTSEGVPSKPRNVHAEVVSPRQVNVTWDPPEFIYGPGVLYFVHWRSKSMVEGREIFSDNFQPIQPETGLSVSLVDLQPGHDYYIAVRVQPSTGNEFNVSEEAHVVTFDDPLDIQLKNADATSMQLEWMSPNSSDIIRHSLMHKKADDDIFQESSFEETSPNTLYKFNVSGLRPVTRYAFNLQVVYKSTSQVVYNWPRKRSFFFQTIGGRPGPPGTPEIRSNPNDTYMVSWREADANGGKNLTYFLEARPWNNSTADWMLLYHGNSTKWLASDLTPSVDHFVYRVLAQTDLGNSSYSHESLPLAVTGMAAQEASESQTAIVLASALPVAFIVILIVTYFLMKVYKKKEQEKKNSQAMILNLRGPDVELATLRELPQRNNFVHQNNALYSLSDIVSDEDLTSLPQIGWEQIAIRDFLGSGAFGEVFEGLARQLPGVIGDEAFPVAIKTLRKGATDLEKAEFLKEAQLMSNFKHEHILSLLGVCTDNDHNFIILELMKGGDLLSYLRSKRPSMFSPSTLSIQDLISICVDVAKGCRYLEELHFVHRDLAARNCLVSSHEPSQRVVKIGDFGLARDIYKNDYYRKEGEGLLPVRWMAPESLVDGVFTSQSDVWAFGVLLWEVMTLGQQPYPARTNVEVLYYVRAGGKLDKPDNCPDDLHQLMLKCWSYNPSDRPTFKFCLEKLQELKRKSAELPPTSVHNRNYIGRNGGVVNMAYNSDDVVPSSPGGAGSTDRGSHRGKSSLTSNGYGPLRSQLSNEMHDVIGEDGANGRLRTASETTDDRRELLGPESPRSNPGHDEAHKYLELLYDSEDPSNDSANCGGWHDGYEVPLAATASLRRQLQTGNDVTKNRSASLASVSSVPPLFLGSIPGKLETGSDLPETDDAKGHLVAAARARRDGSHPLLLWDRRRASVASDGDLDHQTTVAPTLPSGRPGNLLSKLISDSAPLLYHQDCDGEMAPSSGCSPNFYVDVHHRKRSAPIGGGVQTFGNRTGALPALQQRRPRWRDSTPSLGGSTDDGAGSEYSGNTYPTLTLSSGKNSGLSDLSLSRFSSSGNSSSSTSGIEADYAIRETSWC